jgi:hypothetical protein
MSDNEKTPADRETETTPSKVQRAAQTPEEAAARQRISAELMVLESQAHNAFDPNEVLKRELVVKKALAAQLLACKQRVQEA